MKNKRDNLIEILYNHNKHEWDNNKTADKILELFKPCRHIFAGGTVCTKCGVDFSKTTINTHKDWVAQPDGMPVEETGMTHFPYVYDVEDKILVYSPDTGMKHWSVGGGWMFSQGFKTNEEAESCQIIRYTKQMIKAMPVDVEINVNWAGINPMYDPYADVELGRVDRYFEDEQGIVDTTIVK